MYAVNENLPEAYIKMISQYQRQHLINLVKVMIERIFLFDALFITRLL